MCGFHSADSRWCWMTVPCEHTAQLSGTNNIFLLAEKLSASEEVRCFMELLWVRNHELMYVCRKAIYHLCAPWTLSFVWLWISEFDLTSPSPVTATVIPLHYWVLTFIDNGWRLRIWRTLLQAKCLWISVVAIRWCRLAQPLTFPSSSARQ